MASHADQLSIVTDNPFNAETPLKGLGAALTDRQLVYVRNHFALPDHPSEVLKIAHDPRTPRLLPIEALRKLPSTTIETVLECAGNGRRWMDPVPAGTPWGYGAVSNVAFTGTSLANVIGQDVNPKKVKEVLFVGADQGEVAPGRSEHFARSLPLEVALDPQTLLVWQMNHQALSAQHGYPLRLLVPGWYGMAAVKWLAEIRLLEMPFAGYFQKERYVYEGEPGQTDPQPVRQMRVRSLIIEPEDGGMLSHGEIEVGGVAWSGSGAITRVEFCAQGETWRPAELDPPRSAHGLQSWRLRWRPQRDGAQVLVSRATDASGQVQPIGQRWNRYGYGNNGLQSVSVQVA